MIEIDGHERTVRDTVFAVAILIGVIAVCITVYECVKLFKPEPAVPAKQEKQ